MQAMSLSITPAQTAAWRKQIFEQLSERSKREMENFMHYEQAIEQVVHTHITVYLMMFLVILTSFVIYLF